MSRRSCAYGRPRRLPSGKRGFNRCHTASTRSFVFGALTIGTALGDSISPTTGEGAEEHDPSDADSDGIFPKLDVSAVTKTTLKLLLSFARLPRPSAKTND